MSRSTQLIPGELDDPYHDIINLEFKPALHSMFIIILIIMIKKDVLRHNESILFFCKLKNEFLINQLQGK